MFNSLNFAEFFIVLAAGAELVLSGLCFGFNYRRGGIVLLALTVATLALMSFVH